MEQGTSLKPNRFSFRRVTAKAIFTPDNETGGIGLGVIDMTALDEGSSREKVMFPINGAVVLGYDEVVSVAPIYTIKGKQNFDSILPLLYMGTRNADVSQSAATGATTTVTPVVLGRSYDLGARSISNVVATVSAVVKVEGVDYFIDTVNGIIRFPETAAGIASGATVLVTYNKAAVPRVSITAFNRLNQTGVLQLFEMDSAGSSAGSTIPISEATMNGSISRDKGNDGDPTKTNQWALRFAVSGTPTFLMRKTNT